jgi:hypothetical protein
MCLLTSFCIPKEMSESYELNKILNLINIFVIISSFSLILNIKHYPMLKLAIDSVFLVNYFVVHHVLLKFFKSSCRTISLLKSISSILNNSFKSSFAVTL